MALTGSGAISLNEMHIEAGGSSGTTCTINDSDIRGLIGKSSGAAMAFNEWYGASANLASGGTESDSGGYHIHTFTSSGTLTVNTAGSMEIVMIGGGGGGGPCRAWRNGAKGGGGGAGGVLHGTSTLNTGSYTVTIGAGGNGGTDEFYANDPPAGTWSASTDGSDTTLAEGTWGTATCLGGAHGSENVDWYGGATASKGAGGGGGVEGTYGAGDPQEPGPKSDGTQGNSNSLTGLGGDGVNGDSSNTGRGGGGGGNAANASGKTGGAGYTSSISGSSYEYGGGGDAWDYFTGSSPGSKCGAGQATRRYGEGGEANVVNDSYRTAGNSPPGTAYSGRCKAGNGGTGVVIVRYS